MYGGNGASELNGSSSIVGIDSQNGNWTGKESVQPDSITIYRVSYLGNTALNMINR